MNKKLFYLFALLCSMSIFMTSCGETDPCKDVDCGANGTCFEGSCVCNQGYEGSDCNTEWSAKFLGDYSAKSSCLAANETYQGDIVRVSATEIRINEFGAYTGTNNIKATINLASASDVSANALTITNYDDGFNRTFNGTGTISGKVITINYTVDYHDGQPVESCTETITLK